MTLCWYSVAIPPNAPKKTNAAVPTMSVSLTHGERSSGKLCANTNQPIISNCALLDKNEKGRYCKGIACEFSHSQQELDHWSKNVECRESKGKLLEVCRNGQKCKFGKGCSYAHSQKEMQIWMEEHHKNYLESESSIPETCLYTIPCQLGTSCPYAHTKTEKGKLMTKLADYNRTIPRPVPRLDKLLPYSLCDNHKKEKKSFHGECMYGKRCKQAHSQEELDDWEAQRKDQESRLAITRPFEAGKSNLEMCPVLMRPGEVGHCRDGTRCCYAHTRAELEEWTRKSQSSMLGPMEDTESYTADPFLISLIDYQRRFTIILAEVLNAVVKKAMQDNQLNLGSFIDYTRTKIDPSTVEGQQSASLFDLQYLLRYLQKNATVLAEYLGVEESYLIGFVTDLLEIRNVLAHGLYQEENHDKESIKTEKFIQGGLNFIEQILKNDDNVIDTVQDGYSGLTSIQESFRDFVTYKRESSKRMKDYSSMKPQDRKDAAMEAVTMIQDLLKEEIEPGQVTKFVATCLSVRFRQLSDARH